MTDLSNMLPVLFIISASLVAEVPATRGLTQLVANAVGAVGQTAGVAGQVSGTFARSAADFDVFPDKSKQGQRNFTLAEVRQCAGQSGGCLYVVYNGLVLDLTDFAPFHMGGSSMLQQYAGTDATAAMLAAGMPATVFDVFVKKFVVGRLVQAASASASQSSSSASAPPRSPAARTTCGWKSSLMGLCKY